MMSHLMMPLSPVQLWQGKGMTDECDVALIVLEQGKEELMPTVLELLYLETQAIVDDYCILEG